MCKTADATAYLDEIHEDEKKTKNMNTVAIHVTNGFYKAPLTMMS